MNRSHPRRFLADEFEPAEIEAVRGHWCRGLNTMQIALKHYRGDRSMEPRVAAILARLQDERHAARTRLSPPRSPS